MKLVFSGTREALVSDLREIADVVEREGSAEARYEPNSVRNDSALNIEFETDADFEGGILYSIQDVPASALV